MYICTYITPLFAWILNIHICIHACIFHNPMCISIYHNQMHISTYTAFKSNCTTRCVNIVHMYIYIYVYINSDVCLQIQHQDQTALPCAWMLPHGVLGKSKTASSSYMRVTALFAPARSARSSPTCQYLCVWNYIYAYTHQHSPR